MKKILWVSNFAPYVSKNHAGGKTFSYYFDKLYNDENYKISLVCCHWEKNPDKIKKDLSLLNEKLENLEKFKLVYHEGGFKYKIKKLANIESKFNPFTKYANMISNYSVNEILRCLKTWKREKYEPDFIIMEWTQIVLFADKIKKLFPKAKLIASEHDVSFIGFERKMNFYGGIKKFVWKIKTKKLKTREIKTLKLCDYVLVHNKDNKKVLEENGINSSKISWLVPFYDNLSNFERHPKKENIIFYGAMNRSENYLSAIWFIENVLPKIEDLNLNFVVMGANPSDELLKYKSENVVITGFVEDISPYFETAMCFVAPLLLGAGIKVKILEALSSGTPILTNEIGIEGIDAENEKQYFSAKSAEDYEKIMRELYNDKISLDENEIKTFVKDNFDLEKSLEGYKAILDKD